MTMLREEIVLAGGVRTPFGRFGGALKDTPALELAELVVRETINRAEVPATEVDGVVLGNVLQDTPRGVYMAKHAGLRAGMAERITGLVVNRLCGSGLQAVVSSAQAIALGDGSVYVAGGAECLSHVPYQLPSARYGMRLGEANGLVDPLSGRHTAFADATTGMIMGATGDKLAKLYGITREQADSFAYQSHQRALRANRDGTFARDWVPVGDLLDHDEQPRDSSLDQLASLRPLFTDDGVCTAANSSGLNDGAAAVVILTRKRADELGVVPRGRILSWAVTGCDPSLMGIGPVASTTLALDRAGLTLHDVDVIEINEAFAAQVLAVGKELGWDQERVNPNGGAVALGHPLGASGARLLVMLLGELEDSNGRYGLATACIGGGQGITLVVECLTSPPTDESGEAA
jgi:acetyl-CoA C-acetyltransferase